MDATVCESDDTLLYATQEETNDAPATGRGFFSSQDSARTTTLSLDEPFDEKSEMNDSEQLFYTQESEENTRKISTPATRSGEGSMDLEAESLMSPDVDDNELSLMQKRAKNEQRNQAFLSRIGLEYGMGTSSSKAKEPKRKAAASTSKEKVEVKKRGMLLPTSHNRRDDRKNTRAKPSFENLSVQFPFRESEMRKLTGYLEAGAAQINNSFVPAPVFVTGPAGVGKTAIVRACVDYAKQRVDGGQPHATFLESCVNCSALDESSIDDLCRKVYRQFAGNLVESGELGGDTRGQYISSIMSEGDELHSQDQEHSLSYDSQNEERERKRSQKSKGRVSLGRESTYGTGSSSTSMSVWNLGCELKGLFRGARCGVLVLDNAERILSMNSHKSPEQRVNFLSQILLLPQLLQLNLSIIVISKSLLLEYSRLNLDPMETLGDYFQPAHFHFAAYKDKRKIKRIMLTRHIQSMIRGDAEQEHNENDFASVLYEAFLDNIIRSVHDITVDIREYASICRSFWLQYTEPLRERNLRKTLNSAIGGSTEEQMEPEKVIAILDKKFQPRLRTFIEKGLSANVLVIPDSVGDKVRVGHIHELPVMAKYLLLAAFLCQVNSPDRDKELLSIEKNGKRRRTSGHRDYDEEIAFGSNEEESKSLQRRYFPAERMLSVFVSIVTNSDDSAVNSSGFEKTEKLRAEESLSFYNNISFLRDIGMIHEHGQRQCEETIRLREPKYSCPLTKEDAYNIAASIKFPLGRFMK